MRFSGVQLEFVPVNHVVTIPMPPLVLPLGTTISSSPYVIKSITGLDPPDLDVYISGTIHQNTKPQNREIVMLVGFQPNYGAGQTSGDLRSALYPWMTPKLKLPITFSVLDSSGDVLVSALCHIKRIEANMFSKDPEVQITFSCLSPYLTAENYTVPSPGSLAKNPIPITNPGDAPSGFFFQATLTSNMSSWRMDDTYDEEIFIQYSFLTNDILKIDTRDGQKTATRTRSAVTISLLPYVKSPTVWMQLHAGLNHIMPDSTAFTLTEFTIKPNYWGV